MVELQLFDHYFGFLCIQVLVFSMQVDDLAREQQLDSVVRTEGSVEGEGPGVLTSALGEPEYISLSHSLSMDAQRQVWLLSTLWESRKSFYHVRKHVPGLRGWAILLMATFLNPTEKHDRDEYAPINLPFPFLLADGASVGI